MRKEYVILHIDDDDDDKMLLRNAFQNLNYPYRLVEKKDGEEGLKILEQWVKEELVPCLIVLDINMPKKDGKQTFTEIRNNPTLASVPIVIFSTSSSSLDRMFFQGENVEYMVKPISISELINIAEHMLSMCNR